MDTAMRLRKARERAGLTQGQVAKYTGIGKQYISKLERGANEPPTWELLAKLARQYRTSTDYLLGMIDDWRPPENKTLPEGGSELLDYLAAMTPRGRASLLAVAEALAKLDRWWQEHEGATLMAFGVSHPGEVEALAEEIRASTERFGSLREALRFLLSLERSRPEPASNKSIE